MTATKRREIKRVVAKTVLRLVGMIGDLSIKVNVALSKRTKEEINIPRLPMVVASFVVKKGVKTGDKATTERVVERLLMRIAFPIKSTFNEPNCK